MIVQNTIVGGYSPSNIPGVLSLYLIECSQVVSVLDPFRHRAPNGAFSRILAGSVVVKTGTEIIRFKFPPLTAGFSYSSERGDGGVLYSHGISFDMPGGREDMFDFVNSNQQKQFVAIIEDANRKAYIIGNEERGLRLSMQHTTSGRNAIGVSLSAKLNVPSFLLETSTAGFVLADHFRDVDFSMDFSVDFNS